MAILVLSHSSYAVRFFPHLPSLIRQFEIIDTFLGSFVQTMPHLRYAYLISLNDHQAKTDRHSASNHTIFFFFKYKEILSREGHQNCISGSKAMVFLLNFTEQLVLCPA